MEKVRQWCGQLSDQGRLKNRTGPASIWRWSNVAIIKQILLRHILLCFVTQCPTLLHKTPISDFSWWIFLWLKLSWLPKLSHRRNSFLLNWWTYVWCWYWFFRWFAVKNFASENPTSASWPRMTLTNLWQPWVDLVCWPNSGLRMT